MSPGRSPAKETAERRLGRGRAPPTRRRCCDCCAAGEGRAVAASARRAHSPPSTAPIRNSALPIRLPAPAPSRLVVGEAADDGGELGLPCPCEPWGPAADAGLTRSLCRLQRKEPGWLVGEHMQVRRPRDDDDETLTVTDCPAGGRARAPAPARETRVDEAER